MHLPKEESKKRVFINREGEFASQQDWILETDGTALMKVLSQRDIDTMRTSSNDICEGKGRNFVKLKKKIRLDSIVKKLIFNLESVPDFRSRGGEKMFGKGNYECYFF